MNWSLASIFRAPPGPVGVAAEDELIVEPNARGGWSLRFSGDPADQAMGNYGTAEDAARIARQNVSRVRIVETPPVA